MGTALVSTMLTLPMVLLARDAAGRWAPGIGDPTFVGWFTVVAYAAAAYFCFRRSATFKSAFETGAARDGQGVALPDVKQQARGILYRYFRFLGVVLVFLAINKQLDLQSWLTQIGRDIVRDQNLYEHRRLLQRLAIGALGGVAVVLGAGLAYALRTVQRYVRVSLAGGVLLALFVMVRAMSFHHVDIFLGSAVGGMRFNWILELAGIAVVAWGTRKPAARTSGRAK